MSVIKKQLRVEGMTCVNCKNKIEQKLSNTKGIRDVRVRYDTGMASFTYDSDVITPEEVIGLIEELGYKVRKGQERRQSDFSRRVCLLIAIVILYVFLQHFGILNLLVPSQLADTGMGYGMLFVVGVLTSVHCIAMCGGINLSQCIPQGDTLDKNSKWSTFHSTFLYHLGRVISYTVIGFILGFFGMLLSGGSGTGISAMTQGILKLIAGILMVIMGINMLGIFPWLRKFNPRLPKFLAVKIGTQKAKSRRPLLIGLLNGLMPCGPLQSMQIVALACGNPFSGAFSMFLFSLGTVPLLFGLGSIVSVLGKRFTQRVLDIGAVLVVVFGLSMLSQGGSLSGLLSPGNLLILVLVFSILGLVASIPFRKKGYRLVSLGAVVLIIAAGGIIRNSSSVEKNVEEPVSAESEEGIAEEGLAEEENTDEETAGEVQVVNSTLSYGSYPDITVKAGIPVKWIIDAPAGSVNGCNYRMLLYEYGIEYTLQEGENIIEFTPDKAGVYEYTCWMGMVHGSITVTDENNTGVSAAAEASGDSFGITGSCCGE